MSTETKPPQSFIQNILPQIKNYITGTYDSIKNGINENVQEIADRRFQIKLDDPEHQDNITKQLKKTGIFLGFKFPKKFILAYLFTFVVSLIFVLIGNWPIQFLKSNN